MPKRKLRRRAPVVRVNPLSVVDLIRAAGGLDEREPDEYDAVQVAAETGLSYSAAAHRLQAMERAGKITSRWVRGPHRPVKVYRPAGQ